jgi:AAA ATPase-like protein
VGAVLYGRVIEQSVIDELLTGARTGRSGVLVIRGDPGIGKTALLDYAARSADAWAGNDGVGMRVIRGGGVESEAELPFAGLHLLLTPVLDRIPALTQPQQDALAAALGLRRAGSHDRFLVGVAVLSLLAELAENGPLACLADDAHWLDRASARALVFAARRLAAERIAIIFAARDPEAASPASGLRVLRLDRLDEASAAALLTDHADGLAAAARSRILAEACGNPLGLIELPAAYLAAPPAAGWPGNATPALTDRLQRAFEGQVRRLPADTHVQADAVGVAVRVDQAGQHRTAARVDDLAGWPGRPADRHDAVAGDAHRLVSQAVRHAVEHGSINDRQGTHGRRLAGSSATPAATPAAQAGSSAVSPCPPESARPAANTCPPQTSVTAGQLLQAGGMILQNNLFWPPQPAKMEEAPWIQAVMWSPLRLRRA